MATGLLSHYLSGTGLVCIETREEERVIREFIAELPKGTEVAAVDAPAGPAVRPGLDNQGEIYWRDESPPAFQGLAGGYAWASAAPSRVLIVFDWHVLCDTPGHWRSAIRARSPLRSPKGLDPENPAHLASLVVFIGASFDLGAKNQLRGKIPILQFDPPTRDSIRATLNRLHPLNGDAEACVDALCGLGEDTAEQSAAEALARSGGKYDPAVLWESKRNELKRAGLEVWPAAPHLGGLSGLQQSFASVAKWLRHPLLYQKRILCTGIPGMGKSFGARKLAYELRIPYVFSLDLSALKEGTVGASEGNIKRAFAAIRAMNRSSPGIVVLDEIEKINTDGLDSGVSAALWKMTLTELQEDTSLTIYWATLNRLEKLDSAMESRFSLRFFFDLGTLAERESVATIHYQRLGCEEHANQAAKWTAAVTDGYSSREIAEFVCPEVMRLSDCVPTKEIIEHVCDPANFAPVSKTQAEQLAAMRRAAATLRRANDPVEQESAPRGRRVAKGVMA